MKKLFVHHHLGLGDHIICNGLIRYLSKEYSVHLFCKKQNYDNVSIMFSDNNKISLIGINSDKEVADFHYNNYDIKLSLGIALNNDFNHKRQDCCWDQIFYEQAGVPFEISWKYFQINIPSTQNKKPEQPYAFICDKGSNGINGIKKDIIDRRLKTIYSNSGGFFDNLNLIYGASEIHCINSAYIHLIDRLNISSNIKLFYHKNFVYKPYSNFTLSKNWKII